MAERFRRPFQKRHSSLPHQPTNRVNKYLAQAIDARSVDREKSNHVNVVSLCFRNREKEQQVREGRGEGRAGRGERDGEREREVDVVSGMLLPAGVIIFLSAMHDTREHFVSDFDAISWKLD